MRSLYKNKIRLSVFATFICLVAGYYIAVLFHEWAHGTMAWILGYKRTLFDIEYGGWLLLRADEGVPYNQILAAHRGVDVALIGIAGLAATIFLFIFCLSFLNRIKSSVWAYSFFYWLAVWNMVAIFQYCVVQTFSMKGDVGRFTQGLAISPWWVFIPGTVFVSVVLSLFYRYFVPKAYGILPICSLKMRRVFLIGTLSVMFLFIYTRGYTPFSDSGMSFFTKVLAGCSLSIVPILFLLCDPAREWVKKRSKR